MSQLVRPKVIAVASLGYEEVPLFQGLRALVMIPSQQGTFGLVVRSEGG